MKEIKLKLNDIEYINDDFVIVNDFESKTWCPPKMSVIDIEQFKNFKNNLRGWSRTILNKDIIIRFVNSEDNPEYYI